MKVKFFGSLVWLMMSASAAFAQTTAFTYQGKLTDAGNPANGNYDLQFKLFDTMTVGTGVQQGATLVRNPVTVGAGIFTVTLDFGANVFNGADRFLEIGVRPAGSGSAYTVLAPRQPLTSSPYAIQTLNAQQLGGLPASGFVQNTTTTQAGANFNVGGTGTVGNLTVNNVVSLSGNAAPAVAPAGQGRLYFDAAINKVRVSENGGAFVNLVGATGVSGSGTVNTLPLWSAGTTLGNSLISQSGNEILMPSVARFAASLTGHQTQIGTPNTETGLTFFGANGRADLRFDGTLKLVNGSPGLVPPATNGLAITTAGNVGIGTTAPANRLDVNGGIRAFFNSSTGLVAETTGGTNAWAQFHMNTPSQRWFMGTSNNFNGNQFYLVDDIWGESRLTIQPNSGAISFPFGNVGIGATNPASKLDVRGHLTLEVGASPILYTAASGGEHNRYLQLSNSPNLSTASGLKAGGLLVADNYGYANPGKNDLIVKGNVGIGTPTPEAPLNIVIPQFGAALIKLAAPNRWATFELDSWSAPNDTGVFGIRTSASPVFATFLDEEGEWNTPSDRKLKTNIQPLQDMLSMVKQLPLVTYQFKFAQKDKNQIGVIAQDVDTLFPEFTSRWVDDKGETTLGVSYSKLGVIALKAIQEQQALIEQQAAKIESLEKRLAEVGRELELRPELRRQLKAERKPTKPENAQQAKP